MCTRCWTDGRSERGLTFVEVLMALALLLIIMSIAFGFYVNTRRIAKSEASALELQQSARVAVDELSRTLQQAGYGIDRRDPYNPTLWQSALVHGGAHTVAFNADLDPGLGPIDGSQVLTFPGGGVYAGEGVPGATIGAETVEYTLDANADGVITDVDRTAVPAGTISPSAMTDNPLDFTLYRRIHGYDGSAYVTETVPVAGLLFTNAIAGLAFADGALPEPLFTYVLTEDLDGDGELDVGECVNDAIDTCPPSSGRAPLQYMWGDTDFDGAISDAEKDALRTTSVGSTNWSKNRLVSGGSYNSTTLAADIDPTSPDADRIEISDGSKIVSGAFIRIGSGAGAETFQVTDVNTWPTPDEAYLSSKPALAHSNGDAVEILPETLLAATRSVHVGFTALSPRRDLDAATGSPTAGQAGRRTSHGMDYRSVTLGKTIDLTNLRAVARAGAGGATISSCPVSIASECAGSPQSAIWITGTPVVSLPFVVKASGGQPVPGITVTFSQLDPSVGSLSSTSEITDSSGLVSIDYLSSGYAGLDSIDGTITCTDATGNTQIATFTVQVNTRELRMAAATDCQSTLSARALSPGTSWTVEVHDTSGPVANESVDVGLQIDPGYLAPGWSFTDLQADLYVAGSFIGSSDATGAVPATAATTGGSGTLSGVLDLPRDDSGEGTRVRLAATVPTTTCANYGDTVEMPVSFFRLEQDTTAPQPGCVEGSPCVIAANDPPADGYGQLTIAGQPVSGSIVQFVSLDEHAPPDIPPAASVILPSTSVSTNGSGRANISITDNGSPSITSTNPMNTVIDATSDGASAGCASGSILAINRLQFRFDGNTGGGGD